MQRGPGQVLLKVRPGTHARLIDWGSVQGLEIDQGCLRVQLSVETKRDFSMTQQNIRLWWSTLAELQKFSVSNM